MRLHAFFLLVIMYRFDFVLLNLGTLVGTSFKQAEPYGSQVLSRRRITGGANGGLVTEVTLKSLNNRRDCLFPISLLLHNTRPIGHQVIRSLC